MGSKHGKHGFVAVSRLIRQRIRDRRLLFRESVANGAPGPAQFPIRDLLGPG